jgi:hypothetical protein
MVKLSPAVLPYVPHAFGRCTAPVAPSARAQLICFYTESVSKAHESVTVAAAAHVDEVGARLEMLSSALATLPDVRTLLDAPEAEVDGLILQLRRLTALLALREASPDFDPADQVAVRITLQTLSAVALHLRRALATHEASLRTARAAVRRAERQIEADRAEFRRRQTREAHGPTDVAAGDGSAPDASPKAAAPHD